MNRPWWQILYWERGHLVLDLRELVGALAEWVGYVHGTIDGLRGQAVQEDRVARFINTMDLEALAALEEYFRLPPQPGHRVDLQRQAKVLALIHHRRHKLTSQ